MEKMGCFTREPWVHKSPISKAGEGSRSAESVVSRRQSRRLDLACKAFLEEFGGSALVAGGASLEHWQREGKIFMVADTKATYAPSFQFDEKGCPWPAVARVIQVLGGNTSDWGLALWFAAANGWLDGRRPVDLLASAPEEVVEAAEREAEELVF